MKNRSVTRLHWSYLADAWAVSRRVRIASAAHPGMSISHALARQILFALMFPAVLMPLASSLASVAMPTIRDQFGIQADMTAWISTAYTLPFMVLMPVYGRLSDAVGKRRLLLAGMAIFCLGTALTLSASNLGWLLLGQAVQGIGTAGMVPLSIAFISSIFRPDARGDALGAWSAMGPVMGFGAPLFGGFLVEHWGWRSAFWPSLILGLISLIVVAIIVPAGLSVIQSQFWRRFDWIGVALLSSAITSLLFYFSSRPITGVAPLQDRRLLTAALLLFASFALWERKIATPFVDFSLFRRKSFNLASICASLRMFTMSGSGFLMPLFLVDVHDLSATMLGLLLMITPGAMMLIVRFAGRMSDQWGSRPLVMVGAAVQALTMLALALLPVSAPLIWLMGVLLIHGFGVGLMLAPLHQAAMSGVSDAEVGSAAGLYSMVRFAGSAVGTALLGVLLQHNFNLALPTSVAYQNVFLCLAGVSLLSLFTATGLQSGPIESPQE